MTTAYTSLLGLALPVTGELSGTWGDTVNTAITSLLDTAIAGTTSITTDADITLSTTTGASNQARQAIILWNPASGTVTRNITAPAQSKMYVVINASGGTQSIVIRGAGPTTGVTIAKGESATVAWNGSDFVKVSSSGGAITFTDLTVTGNTILGDAAADTLTVNATSTFASPVSFQNLVRLPSTGRSAAAALTVTAPAFLYGVASTYTDTTSSGTIAAMAPFYSIAQPTLSTSNVTTYTNAATLYLANAPAAGGSATITNPYSLYVAAGDMYFGGNLRSNLTFSADNTYDIGASGATRPRDLFLGRNLTIAGNTILGDAAADTLTVNSTITSNLIFTDNTYDIGASGATRPRSIYSASNMYVGRSGAGAFLVSGYNGEIIGGADATGFYYAGGNGIVPSTPVIFGDTGITYYNFNASTSAAFNYRFNGTNRFSFSNAFMGFGTVSSPYVSGMSRVLQVGAIATDEAVGIETVGNRNGYNQTVGRINAYNTYSAVETARIEFTTGTSNTAKGQIRSFVSGNATTSSVLNDVGLGIGPGVVPAFNLDVGDGTSVGAGVMRLNGRDAANNGAYVAFYKNGAQQSLIGMQSAIYSGTSDNLMLWTKAGTGVSIAANGYTANPTFYIGTGGNVNIGQGNSGFQDFGYGLGVITAAKDQVGVLASASYAAGVGGAISLGGNYRSTNDFAAFTRIAAEKTNASNGDYSFNMSFYTTQYAGSNFNVKAMTIFDTGAITLYNTGAGMTFSSSGGNGLRIYGASGTNQWDQYLNGINLRFSNNSATTGSRLVVDQGITSSAANLASPTSGTPDTMYAFYTSYYNAASFKGLTMGASGGEYGSVGYGVSFSGTNGVYYRFSGDTASMITFASGGIQTYTAASGAAGSSISFTTGPYVSQGGTSWTNSSDERRKVILEPITNALAKVRAVRKVIGRFVDDSEDKRRSFFIAQDFLQQFPEVVDVPEKDYDERTGKHLWMGIQYSETIPLIAAALEELADAFDAYVANHP